MTTPLHERRLSALYTDESSGEVDASPDAVWAAVESIGGDLGWYAWSVAWGVRGLADSLAGGPGVRLERPAREQLEPGDVVDWWRVETVERGRLLRLRAETRLPGVAWLDFSVVPCGDRSTPTRTTPTQTTPTRTTPTRTTLTLTTWFDPAGLAGHLYWLSILPAHGLVFGGMRRRIARSR